MSKVQIYGNELYHYGILGQSWGNRRYQNEDGTYTEEGKARRRKGETYSEDYKRKESYKKRDVKELSNKEIREYTERVRLEKDYQKAKFDDSTLAKGAAIVAAFTGVILVGNNFGTAISTGKNIVKNLLRK